MVDIKTILENNGYIVVEGADAVKNMIKSVSDGSEKSLCSGFGVFPNGERCKGCDDCASKLFPDNEKQQNNHAKQTGERGE